MKDEEGLANLKNQKVTFPSDSKRSKPNGTKVESLEQNNRLSPSILYTALACTHARALEYILSELSIRSSTRAVRMYVLMRNEICLCI